MMLFSVMLSGCSETEKTFSGAGVTITLNDTFIEKTVVQAPFYLESQNQIFMSLRESKDTLASVGITTLDQYISAVLKNGNKTAEVFDKTEGDLNYKYAYYEASVNDQDFGYMLLVLESDGYFYSMNFGCVSSKLDKYKDQFFDWAKTIKVE